MIKNVIFDMGNVLIRFDREAFLSRTELSPEDRALLDEQVFGSVEWIMTDRGSMDEPQALESICRRLPERLHAAAEELMCRWDRPLIPIEGMAELISRLKAGGYGLYLLSNASRRQHEYWPRVPGSGFFDGTLISADEGLLKPGDEIYGLLLSRFALKAEECVFIDDYPANIEGALRRGIAGIIFRGSAERLEKELREYGIEV